MDTWKRSVLLCADPCPFFQSCKFYLSFFGTPYFRYSVQFSITPQRDFSEITILKHLN
uniref:Uncharacterized protein n=1 Tax=Anguilla anguilla TaxID=7936 RepID=A0A0E9R6E4_ANGAN